MRPSFSDRDWTKFQPSTTSCPSYLDLDYTAIDKAERFSKVPLSLKLEMLLAVILVSTNFVRIGSHYQSSVAGNQALLELYSLPSVRLFV